MEAISTVRPARPKMGLLSQTAIPSPTIQWVVPARLRHKLRNDVVFVGERSLQIREAVSGIHLEDVAVKSDFDAQIMAAKVINVSAEPPWEAQMKMGAKNTPSAASIDSRDDLPPQILVLTLATRELVFLCFADEEGKEFITFHRPLPTDVSLFERFGRSVAVDPRSRAIAIAATSDYFGVFMLKPSHVLQSEIAGKKLDPIVEERFFRVDGDILFMDFLYPKAEDGDTIILLLLVAKGKQTQAVFYDWDAQDGLREAPPRVVKRLLPVEDRLPTLLAPLTKSSSFMIMTTTSIAIYKDIPSDPRKQPRRYPIPLPDRVSQRAPLWTRWARPCRNWRYSQQHDGIYLCREDGKLFYMEISNEGDIEQHNYLGQLCSDVDGAFNILDIGFEGGDLLLAAGNMGDGGLFIQKARDLPRCVQKFSNWGPVIDSVFINSSDPTPPPGAPTEGRLFVCSGSTIGQGAIMELRHGIQAQIGLVIPLDELSSARDIWTMADNVNGGSYILISDPMSSVLLYLPTDAGEDISAIDEAESGINGSRQTLAAGCTPFGILIQVTEKSLHCGSIPIAPSVNFSVELEAHQTVIAAAINEAVSTIVMAVRSHNEIHLRFSKVLFDGQEIKMVEIGEPVAIEYEPICLSVEVFGSTAFLFVGTGNGRIAVYHVEEHAITYLVDHSIQLETDEDISKAVETLARISADVDTSRERSILFCGLRSGILIPLGIKFDSEDAVSPIELRQFSPRQLGRTSVRLLGRGSFALLTCAEGFWRVSHVRDSESGGYSLERIWITDQNNPAYNQRSIDVFTVINTPLDSQPDSLSESLFCVTEEQLLICTIGRKAGPVPRRISLPGSANRLAYSKHLQSLVVAYSTTELDMTVDPIRRYTRPIIDFVDPDTQLSEISHIHDPDTSERPWRPLGAAGEKITCLLEWTPRQGDEKYHFIVICTSRKQQQDLPRGRVIFLQASRDPRTSRIECTVKHIHKFENPVYSIAPYGASTLMVATGYDIVPLENKLSETRWPRSARYTLLSPAVSITVHEPYLYVSTARESLVILKVSDDRLLLHAHDRVKREGLSHCHLIDGPQLTLASSKGGTVSLLTERGITDKDKLIPVAVSEAHLPLSVSRLLLHPDPTPSNHSPSLYGTTLDGTVYRFSPLRETEWRLLRFLQNLAVRDPLISPFTPRRKRRYGLADIEPLDDKPSLMHVDGDILTRLADAGTSHLRQMLTARVVPRDLALERRIFERFSQMAADVLGNPSDPVKEVLVWMRDMLHVGL
ncbi:hypothetical protein ASPZODRAFT_1759696 [Penicilliopsis zonata CBS 506.65]|uniref:Cleavage/polyadenylation specificity factor A subunit N-terminal domain-containing protein n=1 Tax=Penicilliopsis zonata CBS 506.65 TaxID=1073090 RepID=A0A1L9SKI0_9EURO|nr:hypothetical protein ASPZODRAFT_1759696 [Penicilliopsis zonata CBS 506.65]OJJ47720.1 hypothetical protein ASPZODRAFT_1759696 [Penicilliopsis zonata CBS 506.65]